MSSSNRLFNDFVPHLKKAVVEVLQDLFQEHFQEPVVEQMEGSVAFAVVPDFWSGIACDTSQEEGW